MKPLPLRATLTLVYAGVLSVLLTAEGFAYHNALQNQFQRSVTADLEDRARALHGYLRFNQGQVTLEYDPADADEAAFIVEATRFFQVYDVASGRLLHQSAGMEALGLKFTAAEVGEFRGTPGLRDVQTDRGRLRITSTVISRGGGVYLVQAGALLDRLDTSLREFDRVLVVRTAGAVVLAALMGFIFSGWALAPLRRLAGDATGIEIRNLAARLPVRGAGDELDHVAVAFNQALARLERSVSEMRQFSAAVAHELRTPLAILRGEAEMALAAPAFSVDRARELLTSQLDEYDRLTRLINQILTLARAEAGDITMTIAAFDLSALASGVGDQVEALAQARGITLVPAIDAGVHVNGDAGWIERLMLILLDNAIKFSPPGTHVMLRVTAAGEHAQLSVEDSGVGIDAASLDRVFDPFFRADAAQTRQTEGAGIGLALARWIATQHGATLTVVSTPGRGSTFTLTIAAERAINKS